MSFKGAGFRVWGFGVEVEDLATKVDGFESGPDLLIRVLFERIHVVSDGAVEENLFVRSV